jgi:hypothetical protein
MFQAIKPTPYATEPTKKMLPAMPPIPDNTISSKKLSSVCALATELKGLKDKLRQIIKHVETAQHNAIILFIFSLPTKFLSRSRVCPPRNRFQKKDGRHSIVARSDRYTAHT